MHIDRFLTCLHYIVRTVIYFTLCFYISNGASFFLMYIRAEADSPAYFRSNRAYIPSHTVSLPYKCALYICVHIYSFSVSILIINYDLCTALNLTFISKYPLVFFLYVAYILIVLLF